MNRLYDMFAGVPILRWIGAYGLAIIVLTIGVKLVLAPLFHFQLRSSKRAMEDQRRVAPELAELRKKHKSDPQKLNEETMKLYKEHGVNPLASLSGCLPSVLQIPILIALYNVFYGNAQHNTHPAAFLFVPDLNQTPNHHLLIPGLPIPSAVYLIIPLLAAATTFVQSKMIQQPRNPLATEQELQTQQMTKTMAMVMPLMIAFFAIQTPAGLGLYWFISNCVAIVQQYFVNGWGGLTSNRAATIPTKPTGPGVPARVRPPARARAVPARATKLNSSSKRGRRSKR